MFETFIVIPPYVPNHGRVVGQFISVGAETSEGKPLVDPLNGTVTFTPRTVIARWPSATEPFMSVAQRIVAPIVDGVLRKPDYDPDVDDPILSKGVVLMASEQPGAEPPTLQWTVQISLVGALAQPSSFIINVPDMGVVDLSKVVPPSPEPGTVTVTTTVDRERAEQAALAAEEAAENASLAVSAGLAGVDDLVASALVPYATTAALTSGLAGKQDSGDYALVSQLPDVSGLATTTALSSGLAGKQDAGDYATTTYVDQLVGDIDTALAGILGGN